VYSKIMVPLDRKRFAEAALPAAMYLAQRHRAALELVTVWESQPTLETRAAAKDLFEREREEREADRQYMIEIAAKVQEAVGGDVQVHYLVGQPAAELVRRAAVGDVDLVVMSTHAHGPVVRAFVGSVADQMVRKVAIPMLLVRPGDSLPEVELMASPPFRSALVPVDGSPLAESALDPSLLESLDLAAGEITLLRVTDFGEDRTEANAYLDELAKHLAAAWRRPVRTHLLVSASAGTAIVDFAKSNGHDLIAMATHGRGGTARVVMGSIADTVVRTSSIPTLLFPAAFSAESRRTMDVVRDREGKGAQAAMRATVTE
jgi:nucleotide-binding universal stress UspA family protein